MCIRDRRRTPPVVEMNAVPLPPDILERYRDVTIAIDVMRVNTLPFLVSTSVHLKFGTAEHLTDQSKGVLMQAIKHIKAIYTSRGFVVRYVLADGQFVSIEPDLQAIGLTPNFTSNDEHVGVIERYIRTVKERVRSDIRNTPFEYFPSLMVIKCVYRNIYWLNAFPPKDGLSAVVSPRCLLTGLRLDYHRHCSLAFGEYVHTHEEHDNTMTGRTVGAIALGPTGNEQGSHFFMSLGTGRLLNRARWNTLPMPAEVIKQVNRMGRKTRGATPGSPSLTVMKQKTLIAATTPLIPLNPTTTMTTLHGRRSGVAQE